MLLIRIEQRFSLLALKSSNLLSRPFWQDMTREISFADEGLDTIIKLSQTEKQLSHINESKSSSIECLSPLWKIVLTHKIFQSNYY